MKPLPGGLLRILFVRIIAMSADSGHEAEFLLIGAGLAQSNDRMKSTPGRTAQLSPAPVSSREIETQR